MFSAGQPPLQVTQNDLALAKANNVLAVRLHQELGKTAGNLFFSPFSISAAMSMLLRGAKGATAEEMTKVLGFDSANLTPDAVHESFSKLLDVLSKDQGSYILTVANGIVSSKTNPLLEEYIQDLKLRYQAEAGQVDFCVPQPAVHQINEWVRQKTRGLIPSVLDTLDPDTAMVLLNAIYFKGTWKSQFDPRNTRPKPFFNNGLQNHRKIVSMMNVEKMFAYTDNRWYKALELPYRGNDISMLLVLPQSIGLTELEGGLNAEFVQIVRRELQVVKVNVSLPKFNFQYHKELKTVFQSLGLHSVFHYPSANFKGMSDSDELFVSKIVHKALIVVNEEGSEAAAVTAVLGGFGCAAPAVAAQFNADRPFLFAIFDKRNGMILFMGRVEEF